MRHVMLVHGGLWEPMDAARFWVTPGIVAALRDRGLSVSAPDRIVRATSWPAEAEHLAGALDGRPAVVVAGSNGCAAAARLAVDHPELVTALLLAWPATAADPSVDEPLRADLLAAGASEETAGALLHGTTLRGVTDVELAGLRLPVGVLPPLPENRVHQRRTVDAVLRLVPGSVELPGCPESPRPHFADHLPGFVETVATFTDRHAG